MEPDAAEIRVLGCLIEKQRTTPDAYPLSLNALRLACNQATNRDPVVDYDEGTVRDALHRLGPRRWTRGGSGQSSRTPKYRHLLDETLDLARDEVAVLCVLMLRGTQTAGEIKQRTARMQEFADLAAVEDAIIRLADRELVRALPLRPGQKEVRFVQLLGGDGQSEESADADAPPASIPTASVAPPVPVPALLPPPAPLAAAVPAEATARLTAEVDALRGEVADLRAALDDLRRQLGA